MTSSTHHKIKAEWTKTSKNEIFESSSNESDKLEIVEDESEICETSTNAAAASEKIEILEQVVIYPNQKSLKCHFCDKNFEKSALEEHQKTHEKTFFNCPDCDKKFRRKSSLRKHANFTHKGKYKYKCNDCNILFIDLTKFEIHKNTRHKTADSQKKFQCQNCKKSFASSEYLKRHQVTHNDDFKYGCKHCDQKFKWMTSLQVHQSIHTQSKSVIECNVCFKRFFNTRTLERHQKIHKNVKFKCKLCEKVTSNRKDNIRRHIRHIHSDIARSEISDLVATINEPINDKPTSVVAVDEQEKNQSKDSDAEPSVENVKSTSPIPVINNRVKVIQSVGNPSKNIVQEEISPQKPQETEIEIKLPPKKKAIAMSQSTSSSQVTKPKYDPIQHYRAILGFSKEDDHPTTTEDNIEDDDMEEEEEPQVFPVHWRKRTSQNFLLFRR